MRGSIIGITRPLGTPRESSDLLYAIFLTATLRRVEALPAPQPKMTAPNPIPSGMQFAALHAPDGVFDEALRVFPEGSPNESPPASKPPTLQTHFAQAGVTFPTGSILEHRGGMLHCVNTPDNIALINLMLEHDMAAFPRTVALTFHTLEAPAPLLRDLTRQTFATADDSAMFAAVEAAVARGEARFIQSSFLETKSGNKATHQSACEHRYLESQGTDDKGHPAFTFETRLVGSILEVEPTVGADSRTVELNYSHELHPTPPVKHHAQFRDPASQQPFDQPLTDFNVHKIVTRISLTKSGTKLLTLNPPTGQAGTGVLWATFVKCEVIPQVARSPYYSLAPPPPAKDAKEIHTRSYLAPPNFLSSAADAATPDSQKKAKTAQQILEAVGITFPPGTAAYYGPPSTRLVVTNTNENLDLVEAYVGGACYFPRHPTAHTTYVLQGPGPLLRRLAAQASGKSNHRAEFNELLAAVKAGTVQHLNMARIETTSGTRASSTQANEHTAISEVSMNEKSASFFTQEMRQVGLRVELEPTVGTNGTVDLNLAPEFHTAPPLEHREHLTDTQGRRLEFPLTDYFTSKVTTSITVPSGSARLLSLYKPPGKPEFEKDDILQVIFITCDILRPGE